MVIHIFPRKISEVGPFCRNVAAVAKKYAKDYGYRDQAFWDQYDEYVKMFDEASDLIDTDRGTKAVIMRRNTARDWLKKETETFNVYVQVHLFTTNEIRAEFGFLIQKKPRTRSTPPIDSVDGMLTKHPTDHIHIFHYHILGSNGRGNEGVYQKVELRIFVSANGEKPPAKAEDYPRREDIRRSPANIVFEANQAGMTAYYVARFLNSVDMPGPWATLESELIP